VEIDVSGWKKLVAACLYPVEQDLAVNTRCEKVDKIRKMILEFLLAHAPNSPKLQELAQEYGADKDRFAKEADFCILCGLCVRYCAEVKKKHAVGYVNNGARREIRFIPEIAASECKDCKECFPLCPTSYLQAAFLLTEALSLSSRT
jgi:NADH dehydrogenase/NADH:ubiquinone oxidoreductase subunit G